MTTDTLRNIAHLRNAGFVSAAQTAALEQVAARYAVAITPTVAELIDRDDPNDPIARQFIPIRPSSYRSRMSALIQSGDDAFSPSRAIVHRYPDRVLLKLVHAAGLLPVLFPPRDGRAGWTARSHGGQARCGLPYIRQHSEIWEVILTGGDPLVLPVPRLRAAVHTLAAIDHVKIIRVHTRMPRSRARADYGRVGGGPQGRPARRPTWRFMPTILAKLSPAARAACARIVDAGIPMLSQTVLLAASTTMSKPSAH